MTSLPFARKIAGFAFAASVTLAAQTLSSPAPASAPGSTALPSVPAEGETMHVMVGRSLVLNVQSPLTRVLTSNPDAVDIMAASPTQIVVEGKAAGSSSLTLWDATGRSQVLDVESDLDVASLRSALQRSYPKEHLNVEADGEHLVLTGTASSAQVLDTITKMASIYSKDVVNSVVVPVQHERQVMLEVKFAEVDRTALSQLGFNALSTGAGNTIGQTTTGQYGSTSPVALSDTFGAGAPHFPYTEQTTLNQVLNIFLFRPDLHFGMLIQALEQRSVLEILAEPNLLAVNGEKATFLAGGEFPFPIVQPSAGYNAITIQFKPFGVKLDFTALIEDDNTIRLHVNPEVSTLDYTNALTISGFTVPALSTRRAETQIELKDGQSFGIAGLLDRRATTQLNKIPGLGDIPILGQLFRSKSINKSNTELMVFVTPHIVDPVHSSAPPPAEPKLSVPLLDDKKFDKTSPGHKELENTPQNTPQNPGAK